jgi:hypothetical protein
MNPARTQGCDRADITGPVDVTPWATITMGKRPGAGDLVDGSPPVSVRFVKVGKSMMTGIVRSGSASRCRAGAAGVVRE